MCELVQYATVAETASVSWEEAESCVRGITSLMAHCLQKGENVALVLKDVGVLLIEGTRVQMKFYYDFLERLCGKENLREAVFKVRARGSPWCGQSQRYNPFLPMCRKDMARILGWARAVVLPLLVLNSSSTESLNQANDITPSSLTSIADPPTAGHDCIPGGSRGLSDILRTCDYLS